MSELNYAGQFDFRPLEPVRCMGCGRTDIFPLPVTSFIDRLMWMAYYGPFKCRTCRKKLYRRVTRTWFTGEESRANSRAPAGPVATMAVPEIIPGGIMARQTTLKGNPFTLAGPELKAGDTAPDFTMVDNGLKAVTLKDTGNGVRIISVVPSLDTPVCDAQTKRFNEEAAKLPGVDILTVSMDLPFAQKRWCGAFGVDKVKMLSDHKDGSFGSSYGTLIPDLRIESRAIFVLDANNKVVHAEYVKEVADHPNYEDALAAAHRAGSAAGTA